MINKLKSKYKKDRKMFNNILGTTVVKAISLLLNIYSITAYLHFFCGDKVIYGVWLTIISMLNWVVTFDLGIGNGLRNKLASAIAEGNKEKQRQLVSSAFILLFVVSVVVYIICCVIFNFVNWNVILNVEEQIVSNCVLKKSVMIAFCGLIIHFVLKLSVSILYAFKETTIGSLVTLSINLLIVIYAIIFRKQEPEIAILNISIAYAVTLVVPLFVLTVFLFAKKMNYAKPSIKFYDRKDAIGILSLGGQFFAVQLLLLLINSTNEFIITQIEGPQSVVIYNIYFRLFSAVIALFSVIVNPIWSSISISFAEKDIDGIKWRKRTITNMAILFSVGCFILSLILQIPVNILYSSSGVVVDIRYSLCFALFSSVMIMISATSCIENGINDLKPQIIGNSIAALLKIPFVYIFFYYFGNWMAVVYANIAIMVFSLLVQRIGLNRSLSKLS